MGMVYKPKSIKPIMGEPDIDESYIRRCDPVTLLLLLMDRTLTHLNKGTPVNVKWATDDYIHQFEGRGGYGSEDRISAEAISSDWVDLKVITPRVKKHVDEQRRRSVEKAEVFTPSWICNEQNNLVDEAWFGRKENLFNIPNPDYKTGFDLGEEDFQLRWKAIVGRHEIPFPRKKGRRWRDYVRALRLEVSCGEAPYLTSRYDTTTGKWIDPRSRIGFLDRKLRIVSERCGKDCKEWLKWAEIALQSCYGFEWQGDNVVLARENMLYAVIEAYYDRFKGRLIPVENIRRFAEIISWNIWQMDGIKFVIPNTCGRRTDMLGNPIKCEGCVKNNARLHDGTRCLIMDWELNRPVPFVPPFGLKPIEGGD